MGKKIVVDPVTRIEGHQEVVTTVEGGKVVAAKVRGTMARGFEGFLRGRRWMDATVATSRVCGVCWHVHAEASNKAMEKATGIEPTENGRLMRELTVAAHMIADHILHTYFLTGPDWFDVAKAAEYSGQNSKVRSVIQAVKSNTFGLIQQYPQGRYLEDSVICEALLAHYLEALGYIQRLHSAIALCGSKAPHPHSITPAGVTTEITTEKLAHLSSVLDATREFVETTLLPDAMAIARHFPEHFEHGNSGGNFLALDTCFRPGGTPLFKSGVLLEGKPVPFSQAEVTEETAQSYYAADGSYAPDKAGAYSYVKAPRYQGQIAEVGPLARLMVNNDKRLAQVVSSLGGRLGSSNMCRLVARGVECLNFLDYCDEVISHLFKHIDAPFIKEWDPNGDFTGSGWGHAIAARGDLMHYYRLKNGVIEDANLIVPSTWNFSPMGGPAEQAMVGLPATYKGKETNLEVIRTTHSFDPCMACSIH